APGPCPLQCRPRAPDDPPPEKPRIPPPEKPREPPPEKPRMPPPEKPRMPLLEKLGRLTPPRLPRLGAGPRKPPPAKVRRAGLEDANPREPGARPIPLGAAAIPWRAKDVRADPRGATTAVLRELALEPRSRHASRGSLRAIMFP